MRDGVEMDRTIADFTALLRANGLRVSMAEHLDAFRALQFVGVADKQTFKHTLRALMVKRSVDVPVYDELFDLYFSGLGDAIRRSAQSLMGSMQINEQDFQALMDQLKELLADLDIDLSEMARALLQNDTGRLEKLLREASQR